MNPSRRKPDPFRKPTTTSMDIDAIWQAGQNLDRAIEPPKQNVAAEVPYTRLVHHLDHLDSLSHTVPVDRLIVENIQRKTAPFVDKNLTRQELILNLMGSFGEIFEVIIWIIPIFSDGILVHHIFAADDANQELLRQHRNPVKPSNYDITSL